jgi:hypothetical protein
VATRPSGPAVRGSGKRSIGIVNSEPDSILFLLS